MNNLLKIKCLIIENEPDAQELMQDFVELTPSLTLVGVASNAQEANQLCVTHKPDLLLLDIQMPRFSGFDLLDMLPKPVPLVIITTAFKKYAIQGIKKAVVDYLLKPIDYQEFSEAISKVEGQLGVTRSDFDANIDEAHVENASRILTVKEGRVHKDIPFDLINYLESADNYVKIYLLNASKSFIMTKETTSRLAGMLGDTEFMQINRSYVIRIDQVLKVTTTSIKLKSGQDLPIGTKYKSYVKDRFG